MFILNTAAEAHHIPGEMIGVLKIHGQEIICKSLL